LEKYSYHQNWPSCLFVFVLFDNCWYRTVANAKQVKEMHAAAQAQYGMVSFIRLEQVCELAPNKLFFVKKIVVCLPLPTNEKQFWVPMLSSKGIYLG
jgi:hypothetical protein